MYNRYVPQSDGSFRRSQVNGGGTGQGTGGAPQPRAGTASAPPPPASAPDRCAPEQSFPQGDAGGSTGGFLSGLLPQSFDTEDMIIILLLLLFGNSGKGSNAAFLTLIIYLFL